MKIFKNKIFLMIFATLFAVCLFNSKCFATYDVSFHTESNGDLTFKFPDDVSNYTNLVICCTYYDGYGYYYFPIYGDGSFAVGSGYIMSTLSFKTCTHKQCSGSVLDFSGASFMGSGSSDSSISHSYCYGLFTSDVKDSTYVVYSSCNVFKVISEDIEPNEILFQVARQPMEETPQVVLAEIVEQQETNKVMEEILGILPIVIVVIVSLIAIRKAIAFLRTLLHRS